MRLWFLLIFAWISALCCAETFHFSLPAGEVSVEWRESWFGENPSTVYHHGLARIACYFADAAYDDVWERPSDNVLCDAYKKIGVQSGDIESHYDIDYSDAMWGNDQCAFSIASKRIQSAKGLQTLVFVVIRGTPLNANEWLSNLNIGDTDRMQESIHAGFARAASIVHTALISYLLRHRIDPTDAFLFMTGHSRGAAVANMLSAIVLEDAFFRREHIYTYTFASPNVTSEDEAGSETYNFIWNIVNAEDIVPTVPMNRGKWRFRKYGRTLAFANQTNTDRKLYKEQYVPKINGVYEKLAGREYKPFTTGPFVPIVVTKLVEYLSGDVGQYYGGALNLHTRASNLMNRLFPEKKDEADEEKPGESGGGFGSWLVAWLNRRTNGLFDYATLALGDMHSNDVYLSYMLALDEGEAFSELGYSLVTVSGYEEFAVFAADSDEEAGGEVLARVIDGKIQYSDMKLPVILCPTLGKTVIVGYPANLDFELAITDDTVFPTPARVAVEFFDAAGVFLHSEEKKLHPRRNRVYRAELGSRVLESQGISPERLSRKDGKALIARADLRPQLRFNVVPELNMNTDFNLGFALHVGSPLVFGSLMVSQGLTKIGRSVEVSAGIGNQQSIFSQIKWENELFAKGIWLEKGDDEDRILFVPELRSSLSLKVIGRLRIFSAGVFDFQLNGYNDDAFETSKRRTTIHRFRLGSSLQVAPSLQFGLRF